VSGSNASGAIGGGGGGGGGYFGGGGGASGQTETAPTPNNSASGGGGGGAGASFYSSTANGDISVGHNGTDTPPSITITPLIGIASSPDGATYALGQVVDASFTCQPLDGGCSDFTVANGAPIDTSVVGVHAFVVSAFNASATVHYTVVEPPNITSVNTTTMTVGHAASYGITTGPSYPATPSLSDGSAALPAGVSFTDNVDGTATLAGTPSPGSAGSYHFTITASNGISPDATVSFTLVVTDVPSAPTGLVLHPSAGSIAVTWHAPSSDVNSAITGYTATALPGGASCTAPSALHCTITGLAPTTWYALRVVATNAAGTGPRSSVVSAFPATARSLTIWAVPLVAERNASFELGTIGAVGASTVDFAIPNHALVSCVADLAGQCRAKGRESRVGACKVTSTSRGKVSHVIVYVPLVRAPTAEKVGRTANVSVSHCPAGSAVKVHASDGRTFSVTASTGGSATIHVVAKSKGALTLTVTVDGVTVGTARLSVS
jgi:hypothetical protein